MPTRWLSAIAAILCLWLVGTASPALAKGFTRRFPYHHGYHFIPPVTAYTAVRHRPPIMFGAPAYYYPASYLPPRMMYFPPAEYPYWAPPARAGAYYLSAYAHGTLYP